MLLIIFLMIIFSAFCNSIYFPTSKYNTEAEDFYCPPEEQISPCACYKDNTSNRTIGLCRSFQNEADLRQVFQRVESWHFHELIIQNCDMDYIPASILEHITFDTLKVNGTTLVSLFDEPVKSYKINIELKNVELRQGIEWNLLNALNTIDFAIENIDIRKFGNSFKHGAPKSIKHLSIRNTKTTGIVDEAFTNLKDLSTFDLTYNYLTSVKRNVFAIHSKLIYLDLSHNKISSLPEDIIKDMDLLSYFDLSYNRLKTVSQNFIPRRLLFVGVSENPLYCDCDMKWIPIEGGNLRYGLEGTCSKPKNLKGKKLKELTQKDFDYC